MIVEGRAGVGKTALGNRARAAAETSGMRVLRARASELERGFAYGVVRQLFEPVLFAATESEREDVLKGDAAVAARRLGLPGASTIAASSDHAGDAGFVILHGLYWLLAALSADRPLLLVVDDVHWADLHSLRYLTFLLPRLDELPAVLLVVTRSVAGHGGNDELLSTLLGEPSAEIVTLTPLSGDSTARLLEDELGDAPAPLLVDAFMQVTGGMPVLVRGVVDGMREEGVAPSAAAVPDVERIGARVVRRSTRSQLGRLSPRARSLAHALAVLGRCSLGEATRLARLFELDGRAAFEELSAAGIVGVEEPPVFTHRDIRSSVYEDAPTLERARLHDDAARQLAAQSAPRDAVAEHLLSATPKGDAWVTDTVVAAARAAAASGAPERGAVLYRRALAEPPPARDAWGLVIELGATEASAGVDGWYEHLGRAVEAAPTGPQRADAARLLARALNRAQRFREAVDVLDRVQATLTDNSERALQLEAAAVVTGMNDPAPAGAAQSRRSALLARAASDPSAPAELLGAAAFVAVMANEPADAAAALARRAVAAAGDRPSSSLFARATFTLLVSESYEEVRPLIDESIARARQAGDGGRLAAALASRAWLALRRGELGVAEADARTALAATDLPAPPMYRALNGGILLKALVDQGDLEDAESLATALAREAESQSITAAVLRLARGRLRLEQGDANEALGDFLSVGELLAKALVICPGYLPWRSEAAQAQLALGDRDAAVRDAEAELALARRFGAPRTIGLATRALGLALGGERGAGLLQEAIAAFGRAGATLERGRALADLGASLRRRNHRSAARGPLREALDIAHRTGAAPLISYAETELRATGARPRRVLLTGVDSLTASERRIAELAKRGLTNREIAQTLFITARTVEGHLTSVFRKLQVASRTDLQAVLAQDAGAAST